MRNFVACLEGRHGILIFFQFTVCSVWIFFSNHGILIKKTKPDGFIWSLSLSYTMAGLGIFFPKIICFQKKNILLKWECWPSFALIYSNPFSECFLCYKPILLDNLQKLMSNGPSLLTKNILHAMVCMLSEN